MSSQLARQAALQALKDLQGRMDQVSKESNAFAGKFLFGGMVAVVALLNTDLLVEGIRPRTTSEWLLAVVGLLLVLLVSRVYFREVGARIARYEHAYRRTKHKYEVLLYGMLLGCERLELLTELERPAKPGSGGPMTFPREADFGAIAAYLHDHHGRQLGKVLSPVKEWRVAMALVVLTAVVKCLVYALEVKHRAA